MLLDVTGLSLTLNGRAILRDVVLHIAPREIHVLLGANGSGKSSLAYSLMGCNGYASQAGEIDFNGERIDTLPLHERARRGITLAWQEPARFEGLGVADYLTLGRRDADPVDCLRQVGLEPKRYLDRNVDKTLSGGERKRIELAAVLAMRPRLAVLDEPAAGIDLLSLEEITTLIRTMNRRGAAILLITHREEMARDADTASQLCGGRVVCTGLPQQVIANYKARRCGRYDGATCGYE